jgi:hypothetical protein
VLFRSVIIDAKDTYYAIDQVPEFWDWLLHQAQAGRLKMPLETLEEVSPGRDKEHPFYKWRKDKATADALLLDEEPNPAVVQKVLDGGYGPGLTDDELITIGADPFLVAYAFGNTERIVVTTEVSAPKKQRQNRKLPDICAGFGVQSINTFQLTRALGFSTKWKP